MSNDKMSMSDLVYVEVSSDGVVPKILNPCPECGRQAVEHTPDPKDRMPRMICCFDDCRHVYLGVPDRGQPGDIVTAPPARILNPCPKCSRQAVEHTPDPVTKEPQMICCFDDCRHVFDGVPQR